VSVGGVGGGGSPRFTFLFGFGLGWTGCGYNVKYEDKQ
jgi:hypothetical protein